MDRSIVRLSPAERKVLLLIRKGLSSAEAALTLDLSPRTVEWHIANVLRRFGFHKRLTLMLYLEREGVLSNP